MGNRVHVVKRAARYGDTEAFNWRAEEFVHFLETMNCYVEVRDPDLCLYDEFEAAQDDYRQALKVLKSLIKANGNEKKKAAILDKHNIDVDVFNEALEATECTLEEMHETMADFYKERDKSIGYLIFHSW